MLNDPNRFTGGAIVSRKRFSWPDDAQLAVWVCPNIEHYEYLPDPVGVRDPWPRCPHPDVLGYATKDYGNRVGLWPMFDVMDSLDIRCTVSLNLANFEHYPTIFEACERRRWDYMCHGVYNTQYLWNLPEDEERAIITDCVETYRRLTGRQLAGWFSPAASHTLNTPDLVAEAAIKYYCDFYHDDQPTPIRVRNGKLLSIPYQMDLNDSVLYANSGEGPEFELIARDMFDTLYREGADHPRVMNIAVHPYIMGRPHRLKYLERALSYIRSHSKVWFATGEEIADWYNAQQAGPEAVRS
ncbi:polysaccharide deacetylase family protein [Microvirga pudoricolor]|uniref:polysaccharide deacetylase family protein n=1 Tax=Microvirga pudoricolor TaxID=2778729 RepID=UPI0019511715|nr:polysaccharide deacetylase family protein [Microvirga pudoricolor]MBM6595304.1 polysaccharide deacetylase family protein [Microvirga pudoricolor]